MSADPPAAWGQTCPRSVRLAPDGLLVPAATLGVMLRGGRRLALLYTGHGLEPWLRDGDPFVVKGGADVAPGDLVLCERDGWPDLLRARRPAPDGGWVTALDAFPRRHAVVTRAAILGVLESSGTRPASRSAARVLGAVGLGAAVFAWRRIERAPAWGGDPTRSVLEKYRSQVASYQRARAGNLTPEHLAAIARHVPAGGRVLVGGCGAGGEVLQLARAGYRVTGIDAVPGMIEAARAVVDEAGVAARLLEADLRSLDLERGRFDGVYLTPLLYSFIAGRNQRIAVLERLREHLRPSGCLLWSAHLIRDPWEWIQTRLAWLRHGRWTGSGEPGDWYTWYLSPSGALQYSFLRRFAVGEVLAEARTAGLASIGRLGSHFLAVRPGGA